MNPGGKRKSEIKITISKKPAKVDRNGQEQIVFYWEGSWDRPREFLNGKKRWPITASSRKSPAEAEMRTREKVEDFLRSVGRETQTLDAGNSRSTSKSRPGKKLDSLRTDHTVESFLAEWYEAQVDSDRWQPNSALRIAQIFRDHINPYLGHIPLNELTKRDVRIHFTKTLPSQMIRDSSGKPTNVRAHGDGRINYIYTNFRAAMRAADAKNWIDGDPTFQIHMPKASGPAGEDAMIADFIKALLKVFRDPKNDDVDTLRYALSFFMGMRRGERCGLVWNDIDDLDKERPSLTVNRQLGYVPKRQGGDGHYFTPSTKTGRSRTFPLQQKVVELLRIHKNRVEIWKQSPQWKPKEGFEDLILIKENGSFHALNDDNEVFKAWLEAKKIKIEGLKPGSLRHASATWWATYKGKDRKFLQQVLGWHEKSDLDRYYTRVNQDNLELEVQAGDTF